MSIKKTKKALIRYAKKDVFREEDFNPQRIGHRISIVIPEDVLMSCRHLAKEKGIGYQTLINQILKREVSRGAMGKPISLEERLLKLEKIVLQAKKAA